MDSLMLHNATAVCTQWALVIAVGGALPAVLRIRTPGVLHWYHRALLALALACPVVQPWHRPQAVATQSSLTRPSPSSEASGSTRVVFEAGWSVDEAHVATFLAATVLAGIAVRLTWLAIGFGRLKRLRHAGRPMVLPAELAHLPRTFGTRAELRCIETLSQPVTFGVLKPVVLLPSSLAKMEIAQQEAVIAHELIHVERRDWPWVATEEVLRAMLWFHPAIWWLISRIQLTREQIVDELTVLATSNRRAYMEALLAFADRPPLAPATALARRRHLFKRLALISREAVMSAKRVSITCVAMALVVALTTWYAASRFPLEAMTIAANQSAAPGPLPVPPTERGSIPPPPPLPPPPDSAIAAAGQVLKLEHRVEPVYPAVARTAAARGQITVALTIDAVGNVMRSAVRGIDVRTSKDLDAAMLREVTDAVIRAATDAVQQWRYEAPGKTTIAHAVIAILPPGERVQSRPVSPARPAGAYPWNGLRVGGGVQAPIKTYHVNAVYPLAAREAGIEGVVVLEVRIDESGAVSDARVLRGFPLLTEAALDAVKQWRFHPTLLNGAPVAVIVSLAIEFRADDRDAPPLPPPPPRSGGPQPPMPAVH